MSGIGTTTAAEVFSERVELQPRTSDPSSTEEGEGWIRSDIAPETDQIATLRVDTGGSTIDVPILQTGTATDGVVEALRLSVGGTVGYVPAIPESKAAFPALRLQHNGQVYGWHDARGETAFFDVAITATNSPIVDGETLTVDYSVQNTGGSINDTQDIRLDVGSSERDRDSGVTIASGGSTTGQLSWGSAVEGSYTASVLSDDDVASTSVSVSGIPDSGNLHARWDATQLSLSDNDSVSTWDDETGNGHNLSQATGDSQPTFQTAVINGHSVVRFDGVDDYLDVAFSALSQPVTVYIVLQLNGGSGTNYRIFDSESDPFFQFAWISGDSNWKFQAGSALVGGSHDTDPHIFATNGDGANSYLYQDGTELASGDAGTQDLNGFALGADRDAADNFEGDVGEALIYNTDHDSTTRSEVESYLADKWGITV